MQRHFNVLPAAVVIEVGPANLIFMISDVAAFDAGTWLLIRQKREPVSEVILANLVVPVSTITSNNNSNTKSIDYPHLVEAILPALVWFDFLHRNPPFS